METAIKRAIDRDPKRFSRLLTPRMTPYFGEEPSPKQAAFLLLSSVREVFYGGAGGGGKSSALLMAALQFVDVPRYSALILRRTFADLSLPGALIDRAHEWLDGTDAKWDEQTHTWAFPWTSPPSTLTFGHLEHRKSHVKYKSAEFQYVAFDEVTEFEEGQYVFLFSRLRRRAGIEVPLRMRSASNPGGFGHEWVKRRFITEGVDNGRVFMPATLIDNPHIDREEYERSLMNLPPVLRRQIMLGDWDVQEGGKVIDRAWFTKLMTTPLSAPIRVRAWDLAASLDGKRTAGVLMSRTRDGVYQIEDVVCGRWRPGERDGIIKATAEQDGKQVQVLIEEEPGSGGIAQCDAIKKMLSGYRVRSVKATGDKVTRAGPFATQAEIGNVALVRGEWLSGFLDEVNVFPDGEFCDRVDAASLAFNFLSAKALPRNTGGGRRPGKKDWRDEFGKLEEMRADDWRKEFESDRGGLPQ